MYDEKRRMTVEPRMLRVRDVAHILNTSPQSVYKAISSGELQAIRIWGRSYRIPVKEIERIIGEPLDELLAPAAPAAGTAAVMAAVSAAHDRIR